MSSDERPATPRPMEVELKFRLPDEAAGRPWVDADELSGLRALGPSKTHQVEDRYVDTVDGALGRAGYVARLRQVGRDTSVTVKSAVRPSADRIHRREELEGPADRMSVPSDWPASDARSLILELCGDAALVEIVTIRQLRRKREFGQDGTVIELSLDEVDVVARGRIVEHFTELEAELLRGDETRLAALADALATIPGSVDGRIGKLDAALAAVRAANRTTLKGPARSGRGGASGVAAAESAQPKQAAGQQLQGADPPALAVLSTGSRDDGPASTEPMDATDAADEGARRGARRDRRRRRTDALPPAGPGGTPLARPPGSGDPGGPGEAIAAAKPVPPEPRLIVGKTPGVSADDPLAEAGRRVIRFHFARMLAREPGTRDGSDPEELHGMRVATRRMRAAWRVFGDGFRPERTKRLRGRLRVVAGRLGAVRDLDVLLEAIEAYRADLPPAEAAAIEPLVASWASLRDDARRLLVRELDSGGYGRWVEESVVFLRTDGSGALNPLPTEPHRVRDTAPSRIWAAYERVRAYAPVLRWADLATLHELRIEAKRLRYTVEFVREPLGSEVGSLVERIVALQDHLGALHDAEVAGAMARTFLVEHASALSPAETAAIGRFVVAREREVGRLRRSVGVAWRGISGVSFRRRLGRLVAGL